MPVSSALAMARLLKPTLIDARTGALTGSRELPWQVTALLVSQPYAAADQVSRLSVLGATIAPGRAGR